MIILGIDPGFQFAGFGIIKKEGHKAIVLDYGFLKMNPTKSLDVRIGIFHDFFAEKIQTHGVTNLALETPFLGKNAQNFLKLGYLRGILYLLANKNNLQLHEFSPTQVKLSVTGFGGASKEQVARVIMQLFPTMKAPEKADVTDALAVTLCGLWQHRHAALLAQR
ncbi:MAG: crossover junction endodeoxyribonuclease RuvC [Candidatus Dependentiae bacterium]|nr:crossover junction endodeoxyribonuclease RuvC [Candidatus Dependentiae bacterium]